MKVNQHFNSFLKKMGVIITSHPDSLLFSSSWKSSSH